MSEKLSVIRSFKPKTLEYSFRDLEELDRQGKLDFHLPIQRELKWTDAKGNNYKSMLIFSVLLREPIGEMHCNFANEIYHFVEGKQRNNTAFSFIRGEFALKYLPLIEDDITNELVDVNGLRFEQLSDSLKERITSYKPRVYFYENLNDAQQAWLFKSVNNGMQLTNTEKARADLKDQETVVALAENSVLAETIKGKSAANGDDETIIKNMWAIFNMKEPCFLAKSLDSAIEDAIFNQNTKDKIKTVLDRLKSCNEIFKKQIKAEKDKKLRKRSKTVLNKIFSKKTHIPTLSNVVLKSIQDGISDKQFSEWLWQFFNTTIGSTLSAEYNNNALSGAASVKAVRVRMTEAMNDYEFFIHGIPKPIKIEPEDTEQLELTDTSHESTPEIQTPQINEVTPEVKEPSQEEQDQAQITFNEDQAKLNEQAYADKQKGNHNSSHKKK